MSRRLAALLLMAPAMAGAAPPQDIFLREAATHHGRRFDRLVADIELGRGGAELRLERWLRAHPGAPRDDRLTGYQTLCDTYLREQRFDGGVRACAGAEQIDKGSTSNLVDVQRALAAIGPARWSSTAVTIPLQHGQVTTVRRKGVEVEALFDTGAEIGVVSEATARALGACKLGSSVSMDTTTTPVAGGLVLLDDVQIGNARLTNLPAVVLSDQQAAYSGLKLIIPLSVMVALGRFAYLDHGRRLVIGSAAPQVGRDGTAAYWDPSGIGFAARFSEGVRGVHFDSGSRRTWLFPASLDALSAAERATRRPFVRKIGGLGGEREEHASKLRGVRIGIGGQPWTFDEIEMAEKDNNGESARIGTGLFERFSKVVFDTRTMRMSVSQ
jgi:hypothetical protein